MRKEIPKVTAIYCPKRKKLIEISNCEDCEHFIDEYAEYIVCDA